MADPTRATVSQPEPAGQLPPDYIDTEHTGGNRELLQAFYAACQSEGGTVDEVTLRGIRAAIAADRARRQPEPGEVQELVEWLRELGAKRGGVFDVSTFCANLTRAADLLERLSPPQPVPVSERLPNLSPDAGNFNDKGLLWWFQPRLGWRLGSRDAIDCIPFPTHWLPAHALPLPGEVEG